MQGLSVLGLQGTVVDSKFSGHIPILRHCWKAYYREKRLFRTTTGQCIVLPFTAIRLKQQAIHLLTVCNNHPSLNLSLKYQLLFHILGSLRSPCARCPQILIHLLHYIICTRNQSCVGRLSDQSPISIFQDN